MRDDFLSLAELSFYHVLCDAVGGRAVVCPKVRLGDIFFVTRPHKNLAAFNRIAQKHVDFVVCEPQLMRPLFGVELDDSSHARAGQQTRDEFKDRVFEAARLPLLRVPVQRGYIAQALAARIEPYLGNLTASIVNFTQTGETGAQLPLLCPRCGVEMVVRRATRGDRSDQQFYGCPNYPKCRITVAFNSDGGPKVASNQV